MNDQPARAATAIATCCERLRALVHRYEWVLLIAILMAGAAIRFSYWMESRGQPDYAAPVLDALYHDYWARAILTGNWQPPEGQPDPEIPLHPYVRPPLYPYFLYATYALTGGGHDAPRWIQMALGLFSAWLAYRLARRWFGAGAGLLAALAMSVYWIFPYYEVQLVEPALVAPFVLGSLACTAAWALRPRLYPLFLGGLVLGVLCLGRPNALLLVPVICLWVIGAGLHARYARGVVLAGACIFAAAACLGVLPAIWRNYVVSHELVPVTAVGGQNLYLANNPVADGYTGIAPDIRNWSSFDHARLVRELGAQEGRELTYTEASSIWRERAVQFMREDPAAAASLLVRKFLLMWGPLEVSVDQEDEIERQVSPILRWLPGSFSIILASALLGILLMIDAWSTWTAERRRFVILLGMILATYAFSYLPFTITGRYRVPLVPLLILPAAFGFIALASMVRAGQTRAAIAWFAVLPVLWFAVSRNYTGYEPSLARWNYAQGLAYGRARQPEEALRWLAEAVRLKPDYALARLNYGVALSQTGNSTDALKELDEALRLEPTAFGWQMLGRLKRKSGDIPGAEAAYRAAIKLNDKDPTLWNDLGILQGEQGLDEEAASSFARACELSPMFFDARVNLGRARLGEGKAAEAAREFDAALRMNPKAGAVAYDLAKLRGLDGRYEEAVALLYQALESGAPQAEWLGALAWIRATHPSAELRNGAEAVYLAETVVRLLGPEEPTALVVVAAAYAEAGRFDEAKQNVSKALRLLSASPNAAMAESLRAQLSSYEAGQPYRDSTMRVVAVPDLITK